MPLRHAPGVAGRHARSELGSKCRQPAVRNLVDPLRSSGYMRVSARIPPACGAVAQLGERLNGIQEVEGSTPFGSTCHSTWLALPQLNCDVRLSVFLSVSRVPWVARPPSPA